MGNYKLIKVFGRKNKEGKPYYLAYMAYIGDSDVSLLNCLVTKEQADKLNSKVNDANFDISQYVQVSFNSYKKAYEPKITYGL